MSSENEILKVTIVTLEGRGATFSPMDRKKYEKEEGRPLIEAGPVMIRRREQSWPLGVMRLGAGTNGHQKIWYLRGRNKVTAVTLAGFRRAIMT